MSSHELLGEEVEAKKIEIAPAMVEMLGIRSLVPAAIGEPGVEERNRRDRQGELPAGDDNTPVQDYGGWAPSVPTWMRQLHRS